MLFLVWGQNASQVYGSLSQNHSNSSQEVINLEDFDYLYSKLSYILALPFRNFNPPSLGEVERRKARESR